jgi:predicted PurR-regulated permease PerM
MQKSTEPSPASNRGIKDTLVITAALVIILTGAKLSADLLMPLLLALFIAVICSAPLNALVHRGVPGWAAAAAVGLAVVAVMTTVLVLIDSTAEGFLEALPVYQTEFSQLTEGWVGWLADHGIDISHDWLSQAINPGAAMSFFGGFLTGMGDTLSSMVLIIFTVLFLLADAPSFQRKLALSRSARAEGTLNALRELARAMNGYVATKAVISLVTGALVWAGLWLIDVRFSMLWGFLAFFLNFVPNIGSVLAAIPPILLSILDGDHAATVMIAGLYLSINIFIGNMIEPRVMGQRLGLSTLAVFLSLLFWGWMFEHVGMLLSVPLTMVIKFLALQHPSTVWFAVLISSLPDEEQPVETLA